MKSILRILFILLVPVCTKAQITLTAAGSNPAPGDTFKYYPLYYIPTNSGANVTWDFSTLPVIPENTAYFNPSGTNCNTSAQLYVIYGTSTHSCYYFGADNDSFYSTGYDYNYGAHSVVFHDPRLLLRYPMEYNSTPYQDSFSFSFYNIDGTNEGIGSQLISADAYGTVILPDTTYYNVLRVKRYETLYQTMQASGGQYISAGIKVSESFSWYTQNGIAVLGMGHEISYTKTEDIKALQAFVNVYPNPASGSLNISCGSPLLEMKSIRLRDITGATVYQASLTKGQQKHLIDVSQLATGLYFLGIETQNGTITEKIAIQ